jgi:hypothetical protein
VITRIIYRPAANRNGDRSCPPIGDLKPNLKASPSLFMHAKSAHSVNRNINTHVLTPCVSGGQIWLHEKIGSLSEGRISVIFISMVMHNILLTIILLCFVTDFVFHEI